MATVTLIPEFQNLYPQGTETYRSTLPATGIALINDELNALTPKGKILLYNIASIAAASLFLIVAVLSQQGFLIGFSILCSVLTGILFYQENREHSEKLTAVREKIRSLFQSYTQEFTFTQKIDLPLIPISPEDFSRIQRYTDSHNPLPYRVLQRGHYRLAGGIIDQWSITPLTLTTLNEQLVEPAEKTAATYKPWIDLLVDLSKNQNVPVEFLSCLGKMGGFHRSLDERFFFPTDTYTFHWNRRQSAIECLPQNDLCEKVTIKTPEECREFANKTWSPTENLD